jgi:tetratricopeptide (TPR) repeat protein
MKRLFGILLWALFCLFGTQLSFGQNNREQVLALQRQAIELMDNGDPDQGIVLLRQALTLDPDYWPLTYEMAYAYMVKRDYQKAIKLAKTLYKYEDCNDLVYQLVGNCYDYLKNPKKALKVYAQGLKRFPDSGALYLEQGVVSGMQGHYDETVASFEKGISVAPMFPSNYYRAAQFYAYSTSKVWSQIYGEIMMNLLPSGDRNKEMSELLFRNYKTGIVFSTDSVSVDFYENRPIAITIDMLLAGDVREPYGAVYEAAMQAAAGGERSVDLESLNRIRSRWIDEGLKKLDEGANTVLKYDNQIVVRCGMPVIWKPTTIGCSGKGIRLHSACGSATTGRNSMIL